MRSRRNAPQSLAIALAVGSLAACGHPDPIACPSGSSALPTPERACVESEAGRRWVLSTARAFGDDLTGHHSYPGSAHARIEFGAGGVVASACLREASEGPVGRRAERAVADLRDAPPAPACFAGRRLELAWESPHVTREDIRVARRKCERSSRHRRLREYCERAMECDAESNGHYHEAEREFEACMLRELPLAFALTDPSTGAQTTHTYQPTEGSAPTFDQAATAQRACQSQPTRQALTTCLATHGWEPDDDDSSS